MIVIEILTIRYKCIDKDRCRYEMTTAVILSLENDSQQNLIYRMSPTTSYNWIHNFCENHRTNQISNFMRFLCKFWFNCSFFHFHHIVTLPIFQKNEQIFRLYSNSIFMLFKNFHSRIIWAYGLYNGMKTKLS